MESAPPQPYQRSIVVAAPLCVSPAAGVGVGFGALAGTVVFAALDDAAAAGVVVGFGALVGAAACVELVLAGVAFAALDDATVAGADDAAVLLLDAAPLPPQAASRAAPRGVTAATRKR